MVSDDNPYNWGPYNWDPQNLGLWDPNLPISSFGNFASFRGSIAIRKKPWEVNRNGWRLIQPQLLNDAVTICDRKVINEPLPSSEKRNNTLITPPDDAFSALYNLQPSPKIRKYPHTSHISNTRPRTTAKISISSFVTPPGELGFYPLPSRGSTPAFIRNEDIKRKRTTSPPPGLVKRHKRSESFRFQKRVLSSEARSILGEYADANTVQILLESQSVDGVEAWRDFKRVIERDWRAQLDIEILARGWRVQEWRRGRLL